MRQAATLLFAGAILGTFACQDPTGDLADLFEYRRRMSHRHALGHHWAPEFPNHRLSNETDLARPLLSFEKGGTKAQIGLRESAISSNGTTMLTRRMKLPRGIQEAMGLWIAPDVSMSQVYRLAAALRERGVTMVALVIQAPLRQDDLFPFPDPDLVERVRGQEWELITVQNGKTDIQDAEDTSNAPLLTAVAVHDLLDEATAWCPGARQTIRAAASADAKAKDDILFDGLMDASQSVFCFADWDTIITALALESSRVGWVGTYTEVEIVASDSASSDSQVPWKDEIRNVLDTGKLPAMTAEP